MSCRRQQDFTLPPRTAPQPSPHLKGEDAFPQVHKGYYTFAIVLYGSPRVYAGTAAKDSGV